MDLNDFSRSCGFSFSNANESVMGVLPVHAADTVLSFQLQSNKNQPPSYTRRTQTVQWMY